MDRGRGDAGAGDGLWSDDPGKEERYPDRSEEDFQSCHARMIRARSSGATGGQEIRRTGFGMSERGQAQRNTMQSIRKARKLLSKIHEHEFVVAFRPICRLRYAELPRERTGGQGRKHEVHNTDSDSHRNLLAKAGNYKSMAPQ